MQTLDTDHARRRGERETGAVYDSGETPRQMCKRLIAEHEGKDQGKCETFARMLSWIEDEKKRLVARRESGGKEEQIRADQIRASEIIQQIRGKLRDRGFG